MAYDVILWIPPVDGHGFGLCDRLRAIAGVSVLASGFNLPIVMPWPVTDACPYRLDTLFDMPHIHCIPGSDSPLPANMNPALTIRHTINAMPQEMYRYYQQQFGHNLFDDETEFLALWSDVFRTFRPITKIKERVKRFQSLNFRKQMLGVHLRRTDKFRKDPDLCKQHDEFIIEEVIKRVHDAEKLGIYLAADNDQSYTFVKRSLIEAGLYVVGCDHHYETAGLRQTNGEDLVTDIFLLGSCQSLVASVSSGVVHYAGLLARCDISWTSPDDPFDPYFNGLSDCRKEKSGGEQPIREPHRRAVRSRDCR